MREQELPDAATRPFLNPADILRAARTPGPRLAVATLVASFGCFITLGMVMPVLNVPFGLWFTELFVFFAVAWELTRYSGRDPVTYTGLDRPTPRALGAGVLLGLVNFVGVVAPIQLLSKTLLDPYLPGWIKQDASVLFDTTSSWELVLVVLAVGLAAPVAEEICFRGVVQQGLAEAGRPTRALVVTSIVFSAFHLDGVGFLSRVELGALFGVLFYASRSVWPGIAAHATNNLISVGLYLASAGSRDLEAKPPSWRAAVAVAVLGSGVLYALLLGRLLRLRASAGAPVDATRPRPASLWPALARWGGGAVLAVALLVAVDHRGIQLNFEDLQHPVPRKAMTDAQHAQLQSLRSAARRGRATVKEYEALHRMLWHAAPPSAAR